MRRNLLVIGGYTLGAFIIVVGTIVLVAYGSGYRYDFRSGKLIQRGLLLLESKPSDASILQNGVAVDDSTPYRKSLDAGTYTYTLEREGYRTWTKQLEIIPSRVTATQYVLLMPQRFEVNEVVTHPTISQFVASRDRSRIAYVVPSGADIGVWVLNARNQQSERIYQPVLDAAGQPQESMEIMSWSDDASRILLKRTTTAGTSPFVLAANGDDPAIDLNALFQQDVLASRFSRSDSSQLLWNSPQGLRRLDLDDRSISEPFARGVMAFSDAGNRIYYVSNATPQPTLWRVDQGGQKQLLDDTLPASQTYDLAYSTYIGTPQIGLTAIDSRQALLYTDIEKRELEPLSLPAVAGTVSFNGDGRFMLMSGPNYVATYDQELQKQHQLSAGVSPITGLSWFDNYHVQYVQDGKAVIAEYDGNYATGVTRVADLAPYNAPNDRSLYVVAQTSTGAMQIRSIVIRQ